jgi:hypothetical protein
VLLRDARFLLALGVVLAASPRWSAPTTCPASSAGGTAGGSEPGPRLECPPMWVLYVYGLLVVVTGVSSLLKGAMWPGTAGILGPALCTFAGSGVRGSFMVGTRGQKLGGLVGGGVFLALGSVLLYLSGYRVSIFGVEIDGVAWGLLGAVLGFVFTPRSAAE